VRPALHAGLLAVALALTAALFDAEPLWVPALALALLVAGNVAWVTLGAWVCNPLGGVASGRFKRMRA